MSGYISPILTIVIVGSQLAGTSYHNCNHFLHHDSSQLVGSIPYPQKLSPKMIPKNDPHIIPKNDPHIFPYSWLNYTIPPPMRHMRHAAALAAERTLPRSADVLTCSIQL